MDFTVSQAKSTSALQSVELPPRVVGRFGESASGHTLIVLGAIHGNEPAGYQAMRSLFSRFEETPIKLRGSVIGLVGNRQALAENVRFITEDLNRLWLSDAVARIQAADALSGEMREARDLYLRIEDVLGEAPGPVYALDIHSTSGPGPAFVIFDDSPSNWKYLWFSVSRKN
jgi:succinylglutamate desuccinylase